MTTLYIASKSSNPRFALDEGNIIAVCWSGIDPGSDARTYAFEYAKSDEENTYVYEVEIKSMGGYKIHKEVVGFGPTK